MLNDVKEKIAKKKKDKIDALGKHYTDLFNSYLAAYFANFSEDEELNKFAYEKLNKDWKELCYKVNSTQKQIVLKVNLFESEVALIKSKYPQFQSKEVITDLTKL